LDNSAKKKLISDIENQLDDFFSEQSSKEPASKPVHTLEKLKSAVLSIDWEITDACLLELIVQTENLMPLYEKDPITSALLRMLRGLGRYISKRKAQAHQDAIKRIMSVFASLELLIEDKRLGEGQKKQIVAKEIQAFKKLKQQIDLQKPAPVAAAAPEKTPAAEKAQAAPARESQNFKQAINEMEQRLRMEVQAVRSQLVALEKELSALRKK
jgi:hypothetical protein